TERDIAKIEKTLDVKLPAHYQRFLLDHVKQVAKAKRAGAFVPFFITAKEIIDANKELRADPSLRNTNQDTESWPLKFLIVGSNGSDDWCVDLTSKRAVIWFFDSEAYGTFRQATPSTWAEFLKELESPKPAEPLPIRDFVCKKGEPTADGASDGSFTVTDAKGRTWVCYERREPTQEDLLARVRGEVRTPSWLGEKGLRNLTVADLDELRACLSKER
ncbi:MAG TPA: SMI1/KNR4 family protein, partial [Gemmataceae bacterium]|nr:SMI1/KNR4 family protein [Gemmataceae bacterium]